MRTGRWLGTAVGRILTQLPVSTWRPDTQVMHVCAAEAAASNAAAADSATSKPTTIAPTDADANAAVATITSSLSHRLAQLHVRVFESTDAMRSQQTKAAGPWGDL